MTRSTLAFGCKGLFDSNGLGRSGFRNFTASSPILLSDFWEDSTSSGETIPYDSVRGSISSESPILLDDRGSAPLLSREELWMSSSWFAQGPRRAGDPLPPIVVPSPPPPALLPSPPPPRREFRIVDMQYWPSNQEPPSRAPPAELGTEWTQPPAIQATSSTSAWEKWSSRGGPLRRVGKSVVEDETLSMDVHAGEAQRGHARRNCDRREAPPGPSMTLAPDPILVESPVPVADEVSRLASPPVVGRENTPNEPPEPAPAQEEEREEPSASSKGKGKAKATEEDEEMTSPAEREEGLYEQGIMVYSAMNGQRRTWLQFFDLDAAGRALTALPTAGGS
ncbi:hypothetical protein GGX14DRAFT_383889 [Mycena pura]|uniref:Uncharacterized protein n=1 Tax=Mycena pura TaxID=153505 RepID=A0AAD7E638_9AGAR|nr:hypothetical protein GGX14DRAFT_383889 [Mycena pura]